MIQKAYNLFICIILFLFLHTKSSISRSLGEVRPIQSGEWVEHPGRKKLHPIMSNYLVKEYGLDKLNKVSSDISDLEDVNWKPSHASGVTPIVDPKSMCFVMRHLTRIKQKSSGGILFIGDDIASRLSMTTAAALFSYNTSTSCSHKSECSHQICGKDIITNIKFISTKEFMHRSCISLQSSLVSSECSKNNFITTLSQYDVVVLGFGSYFSLLHTQRSSEELEKNLISLSEWLNNNYLPSLTSEKSTLIIYQSVLPSDKYCDRSNNKSDEQLHRQFLHTQHYDDTFFVSLRDGALGHSERVQLHRVDIAGAVFAREEAHRSSLLSTTEMNRGYCELHTLPSDSIVLFLSHIYGALLQYVQPTVFPKILTPLNEDYDRAIQRIALSELNTINYLRAYWHIKDMRSKNGWILPTDTAITLSITDIRYAEAFAYWFYSRRLYGVEGIMIAMDSETCDYIRTTFPAYVVLCVHIPLTFSIAPPHKLNTIVGAGKVVYPLLFLAEFNIPVIFSEMDIFWKANPFPFLNDPERARYDIQVSAHVYFNSRKIVTTVPKELNIGFFFVRPTPSAIVLFTDLLHFLILWPFSSIDIATMDQKLFDLFIRNSPGPVGEETPCCMEYFAEWDKIRPSSHFKDFYWLRLPGAVFTHNDAQELAIVPETLAYHISWGIDPPSRRIHCAYTLGLLPTNYTHITTYDNQVCFPYLYQ